MRGNRALGKTRRSRGVEDRGVHVGTYVDVGHRGALYDHVIPVLNARREG